MLNAFQHLIVILSLSKGLKTTAPCFSPPLLPAFRYKLPRLLRLSRSQAGGFPLQSGLA